MSGIRTYVVGRDPECAVRLDDGSVSRLHAEVVRLPDGVLFVTDRASLNGTFVLEGGEWRAIRQAFLAPGDQVRFGECRMSGAELEGLCPRKDHHRPGGAEGAAPAVWPVQDEGEAKRRDAETGEIVYNETSPGAPRRQGH